MSNENGGIIASSILVLSASEIAALLPMDDAVEVMAEALAALARDEVHNPLRFVVRPPQAADLLGLMPAYRGGAKAGYGLKEVCVVPSNSARGLDPHQGAVLLHHPETGVLLAVANASAITAIRTAAVSAVATRLLARPEASTLALLGSGVQARSHLAAMRCVRPIERLRIWSRTTAHARALAGEVASTPGLAVDVSETARGAVEGADIVVTVTAAREPIVERAWLSPGVHVNAVGSSIPTARELDSATMAAGRLFVDRRESTLNESGDYLFAAREGAIGPDAIAGEIGELLIGAAAGRGSPEELTIFVSLGLAVEDLAAVQAVYERARASGRGTLVAF